MQRLVEQATKIRHTIDEEDKEGDYVELNEEIKLELEKNEWISSKLFHLLTLL